MFKTIFINLFLYAFAFSSFWVANCLRSLRYMCDFCLPFKSSQTTVVSPYFQSVKARIHFSTSDQNKKIQSDRLAKLETQRANFSRLTPGLDRYIRKQKLADCFYFSFYFLKISNCRKISFIAHYLISKIDLQKYFYLCFNDGRIDMECNLYEVM